MSRQQVEKITKRHGATLEKKALEHVAPAVEEEKPNELLDIKKQEEILHPDPRTVELESGVVVLHKPSIMMGRRIYGFIVRVWADVAQVTPGDRVDLFVSRTASLLCSRQDYERQLCEFAAYLFDKPGRITEERAAKLADELQERLTVSDLSTLFAVICDLAGFGKADPKNSQTRRQRT